MKSFSSTRIDPPPSALLCSHRSKCGTLPPESCFFSLVCSTGSFMGESARGAGPSEALQPSGLFSQLQQLQLTLCQAQTQPEGEKWLSASNWAFFFNAHMNHKYSPSDQRARTAWSHLFWVVLAGFVPRRVDCMSPCPSWMFVRILPVQEWTKLSFDPLGRF